MKFTIAAALTALAASATVQAQNCNPSYNATSAGSCIDGCNEQAGKQQYSDWTNDPSSPNFIKSLSYMCGKGTPQYTAFMTAAGTCMMSCSQDEQNAFSTTEFPEACAWYNEHKDDTCSSSSRSNSTSSDNSSSNNSNSSSGQSDSSNSDGESAASTLKIVGCTSVLAAAAAYYLI